MTTLGQSFADLLSSVALEEAALAHLINAEAEKVQVTADRLAGLNPAVAVALQRSVRSVVQTAIKMQILLQFKLDRVLAALGGLPGPVVHVNVATVSAVFNGETYTDTDPAYFHTAPYLASAAAGRESSRARSAPRAPATTPSCPPDVPEVSIDVERLVSPDGGLTYLDADTPPGPGIPQGTDPLYKFVVTNTGGRALTDVAVSDDVLGPVGTVPALGVGQSREWIVSGTWSAGPHANTATASGSFQSQTVTDTDPAHYFGVAGPSIEIQKLVSVDGGLTWEGANTPPGPALPPGVDPQFRFVVTNTGATPLTDIVVTDTALGPVGTLPSLMPGDSHTFTVTP
jgi:hypothetical protein